jgi:hypothetical protein
MPKTRTRIIPGVNIQAPWSELILSGQKTVETRSYPVPPKYIGKELAIIETPGSSGLIPQARIVGIVVFSGSHQYETREDWLNDKKRHLVEPDHAHFSFSSGKPKYGWEITKVIAFDNPVPAPKQKGIVFTGRCIIPA